MTFLALHRADHASLATDRLVLDANELRECESAAALLEALQSLHAAAMAEGEAARGRGFERGVAEGREWAMRDTAPALIAACHAAVEREQRSADAMQQAVISLALHVVRRLAHVQGAAETVAMLARRAWQELTVKQTAVLRVHPSVHAAVSAALRDGPPDAATTVDIRADETLGLTDCIFESPTGQLIAGLDAQLARVEASLRHSVAVTSAGNAR